jgi:hypothetical protein
MKFLQSLLSSALLEEIYGGSLLFNGMPKMVCVRFGGAEFDFVKPRFQGGNRVKKNPEPTSAN